LNSVQARRTETTLPAIHNLSPTDRHASAVFCGDFLHDLDLEITLGLELLEAPDLVRLKAVETLAPCVDRLLADLMLLGHDRYWLAIGLADDRDHLLFRETRFAHCSLRIGSQSLT
jgi:hypothetical protein